MVKIRSLIFDIFISAWGIIIPIAYSLSFITNSSKTADKGAKVWAQLAIWVLEKLCKIKYEIRGLENLPKDGGCIIACKHQSMWETIVMHLIFHRPVYAYKKELLKIPFYGWFLSKMSGITVDRKGGATALKKLLSQSQKYLNQGQTIILFPQGTRTPIGATTEQYPYQSGIAAIYSKTNALVVPATLNSGYFWGKSDTKKPGTIILEFLPPIESGLNKREFLSSLEKVIEENNID